MKAEELCDIIGADFYTGVPDSQLRALCDFLLDRYGTDSAHHIIAANEGNCTALAAGYHLATGKSAVVYMQNSGEGNMINPAASLLNREVYAIPCIFIIGWRGEPGVPDEPQHVFQGKMTIRLLEDMEIDSFIIGKETSRAETIQAMERFRRALAAGKSVAFVIRKGALSYESRHTCKNRYPMAREDVIRHIVHTAGQDTIVATTGKASRELFEIRTENGQGHQYDFLTVGSMGHSSSIAFGIAVGRPEQKVWCIDGDGAAIMHMGSLAVIGSNAPQNLVHIILNNGAHETVGGMPTAAQKLDLAEIAKACGYPYTAVASCFDDLDKELSQAADRHTLSLIEVKCAIGSRHDLGRPSTSPIENKRSFMNYLSDTAMERRKK